MLLVIAIIAIIAGIGSISLKDTGSQRSLHATRELVSNMFVLARQAAINRGISTRVIIYYGTTGSGVLDSTKYLRYIGMVYKKSGDTNWSFGPGQAFYFPENIYFIVDDSTGGLTGPSTMQLSLAYGEGLALSYPSAGATKDKWYYYEFDSRGRPKFPTGIGGFLVLFSKGQLIAAASPTLPLPNITIEEADSIIGFFMGRHGTIIDLESVDDIDRFKDVVNQSGNTTGSE